MPGVWILAEQFNNRIHRVSFELITRGTQLAKKSNSTLSAILLGSNVNESDIKNMLSCGLDQIIYIQHPTLENFHIEPYSKCMVDLIKKYQPDIILAGATTTGRTLMPYAAIKANTGLTADCTALDIDDKTGELLQTRPAIGGNIMATIKTPRHRPQMATVRPRSTPPAPDIGSKNGKIIKITPDGEIISRLTLDKFVENKDELSLAQADTVVAVGKGIKKKDNLKIIYDLALLLNAAVGATREVIDRGWLTYPHQIGLSGQTISPKLYIGIGISGTIQHIAGMQTSQTIIAINKDPNAQIFKIADYGIIGDLFDVLPVMLERLIKGQPL